MMIERTTRDKVDALFDHATSDEEQEDILSFVLSHFHHGVAVNMTNGEQVKIHENFENMLKEVIPSITEKQSTTILFKTIALFWVPRVEGGE